MDYFQLVIMVVFALGLGSILFRRLKYGSWTGSLLQGSVEQTCGEVVLDRGVASSRILKVVVLKDGEGESFVGLVATAKAPLGASTMPFRLSKDQARELARLLATASA